MNNTETTLSDLLDYRLEKNGDTQEDITSVVISKTDWGEDSEYYKVNVETLNMFEGDSGYGGEEFPDMIAWTDNYVYYKHVYDGSESVKSKPRNPDVILNKGDSQ